MRPARHHFECNSLVRLATTGRHNLKLHILHSQVGSGSPRHNFHLVGHWVSDAGRGKLVLSMLILKKIIKRACFTKKKTNRSQIGSFSCPGVPQTPLSQYPVLGSSPSLQLTRNLISTLLRIKSLKIKLKAAMKFLSQSSVIV